MYKIIRKREMYNPAMAEMGLLFLLILAEKNRENNKKKHEDIETKIYFLNTGINIANTGDVTTDNSANIKDMYPDTLICLSVNFGS